MAQLESGKPHSLKEIFCGENDKIIVPDLQRDYCWGDHIPFNRNTGKFIYGQFVEIRPVQGHYHGTHIRLL